MLEFITGYADSFYASWDTFVEIFRVAWAWGITAASIFMIIYFLGALVNLTIYYVKKKLKEWRS